MNTEQTSKNIFRYTTFKLCKKVFAFVVQIYWTKKRNVKIRWNEHESRTDKN